MNPAAQKVAAVANGVLTSVEIAKIVGLRPRHVRKLMKAYDLPRLNCGAQPGKNNHQFVSGRRIGRSGYALITAPKDHPYARKRTSRDSRLILEHRFVMEGVLGRYLQPEEIVDHIDGLTLHNAPDNLRLFASNAEHLRATLTGKVPRWTDAGYENMKLRHRPGVTLQLVDNYRRHEITGDVRLRQILLAALSLGIDSPYLLGTHHHTTKAGIDMSSRSTIELALADLCQRCGWNHIL